jgi:2-polyprenyl-3-methyl-5-hydroxy-6-metoxy-1,4-benzoquinol methylase
MKLRDSTGSSWSNVHLPENKLTTVCDRVVASLVVKYTAASGSVLDLGVGVGNALALIRDSAPQLTLHAADISQDCLDRVQIRVPTAEPHLIDPRAESLAELGRESFDCCLMSHVLEHTERPLDTLRSALELVKPGGTLVAAVPNPVCPLIVVAGLLRFHYVNRGHVCCWDRSHWMNFLEQIAGVEVAEYQHDEVRLFPYRLGRLGPFKALERGVSVPLPWWSQSHIAVIRKPLAPAAGESGARTRESR